MKRGKKILDAVRCVTRNTGPVEAGAGLVVNTSPEGIDNEVSVNTLHTVINVKYGLCSSSFVDGGPYTQHTR